MSPGCFGCGHNVPERRTRRHGPWTKVGLPCLTSPRRVAERPVVCTPPRCRQSHPRSDAGAECLCDSDSVEPDGLPKSVELPYVFEALCNPWVRVVDC